MQENLIPNLESNSVIVVDNASYHNVQTNRPPTTNSKKCDMLSWLETRNVRHRAEMTKVELYDIIKMHKPQYESFAIDGLLAEHGHTVVRLPPYHPDLNPIEQIWGIVKSRVAVKNVTFKLQDVKLLAEETFADVSVEQWAAVCRHVKAVEEEYISREYEIDSVSDKIIINLNDDTSDSSVVSDDDDMTEVVPLPCDSE